MELRNHEEIIYNTDLDLAAGEAGGYVVQLSRSEALDLQQHDIRAAAKKAKELGRPLTDAEFEQFRR